MKPIADKKQTYKEKMDKICKDCYNQTEKSLSLYSKTDKWAEILQYTDWSELRKLCLGNCRVSDSNVNVLVGLNFPNLKKMEFYANLLTEAGVKKLCAKVWPKLEMINFTGNNIGDSGLDHFVCSLHNFPLLTKFSVEKTMLTAEGLKSLINTNINQLTELYLSLNNIGSRGVKYLIKADLPLLQQLQLSYCELSNEGSKYLSKGRWVNLKKIRLNGNNITLDGSKVLTNNCWNQLTEMIIWEIQPIQLLCMGRTNWSPGTEIVREMKNYNFCRQIRDILKMRTWK